MNIFLILSFLFFIGSTIGWVMELFFRRFISKANPERKWINPGFLVGPYLPLYGFGLCLLYLLASLEKYIPINSVVWSKVFLFIVMALCMTIIEFIAGKIFIVGMKVKLWDYSNKKGNIQGIICPQFSFIWACLGALYYFLIHPQVLDALNWLSENLAFSFFIGLFFGVFIIDVCYSVNIISKIRKFADEYHIIVKYEELKEHIRIYRQRSKEKSRFLLAFKSDQPLSVHLKQFAEKHTGNITSPFHNRNRK